MLEMKTINEISRINLQDFIIDLAWSPDYSKLAAATVEGEIFLIHLEDNNLKYLKVGKHSGGANSLSWRHDSQEFATGGHDGFIVIWDGKSGQEICRLEAGSSWVERVSYNPQNKNLASSAGRTLKIWAEDRKVSYESSDHCSTISDISWNPDGSGIAVAAYNGVTVHSPKNQKWPRKYKWKGSSLIIIWSPDSKYIVTGEQDSTVHFWNRQSGRDAQMHGFPTKVLELSWDSTGRWLATGGGSQINLWDCSGDGPAGRKPISYGEHTNKLTQLSFQPEGDFLVSTDEDSLFFLWAPNIQKQIITGTKLSSPATKLKWSKSSKIAVGQRDGSVVLFDIRKN